MNLQKNKGFTLAELLTVLVTMSLVMGAVVLMIIKKEEKESEDKLENKPLITCYKKSEELFLCENKTNTQQGDQK